MKIRHAAVVLAFLLPVSFFVGIGVSQEMGFVHRVYERTSFAVRSGLGLEKNWNTPPGPEQAAGRSARPCPAPEDTTVLVTGGQSNAANVNPVRHKAGAGVSVWFDGRCFPAADPLLGATAEGGSLWSMLGDALTERLDTELLLINGAVGGTQYADWLDSRSGYYAALTGRVSAAAAQGYDPDLVLWHQGETDAGTLRDMDVLDADLTALLERLLADIGAPVYLFQASRCSGARRVDGVPEVVATQQQVAARFDRVLAGMNTDRLGRDYRWDTCHFNSFGRARIVARVAADVTGYLRR